MYFITNFAPIDGVNSKKRMANGGDFQFNLEERDCGKSVYFCTRNTENSYNEIGYSNFFKAIKELNYKSIMLFIHGFNNDPEDAFNKALSLQKQCDERKEGEVLVIPFIWPCKDSWNVISDYNDDRRAAKITGVSLCRTIEFFLQWQEKLSAIPCLKRLNIMAHSMGNLVLQEALAELKEEYGHIVPIVRNSFLVAADIRDEALEKNERGKSITDFSRNVVVYHALDDIPLKCSKILSPFRFAPSSRLGQRGPDNLSNCSENVYSIDCNKINDYDELTSHTYLTDDRFFNHIFNCIRTSRVESKNNRFIIG